MFEKIKEIVADQLGIDAEDIKLESNFKEDLEADSLDLFELVMSLEEEYGVEIPSEDLEKIETVNDIIEYCEFPPEIELEPEPFDVLSSIDTEIIQEYLESIKKENNK